MVDALDPRIPGCVHHRDLVGGGFVDGVEGVGRVSLDGVVEGTASARGTRLPEKVGLGPRPAALQVYTVDGVERTPCRGRAGPRLGTGQAWLVTGPLTNLAAFLSSRRAVPHTATPSARRPHPPPTARRARTARRLWAGARRQPLPESCCARHVWGPDTSAASKLRWPGRANEPPPHQSRLPPGTWSNPPRGLASHRGRPGRGSRRPRFAAASGAPNAIPRPGLSALPRPCA